MPGQGAQPQVTVGVTDGGHHGPTVTSFYPRLLTAPINHSFLQNTVKPQEWSVYSFEHLVTDDPVASHQSYFFHCANV